MAFLMRCRLIGFGWVVPCFGGIAVGLLLKAIRKAN
jgi:hypothetical protein